MTTFLEQEINSQPEVIAGLLEREIARVTRIVAQLPRFNYALIAARGTSDQAAAWSGQPARLAELQRLPDALTATLAGAAAVASRAERYRYMEQCAVIGRGYNFATVFELTLKLKELTYVMASAYSSADFRHGPIATVSEGLPVILMMPAGAAFADMLDLAQDLKARGAELLIGTDEPAAHPLATTLLPIEGAVAEWLSPITAIVP